MKLLILFLLVASLSTSAQNRRKYFIEAQPGIVQYNGDEIKPSFGLSFGAHPKNFCIGLGASFTQITQNTYIPIFLNLSLTPESKKFAPYASFKIGQGIYNQSVGTNKITGTLYLNGNIGISVITKGLSRVTLAGGFLKSQFQDKFVQTKGKYYIDGYAVFLSVII